jgi:NAD(P)H-hydrate repair Nnr-like enzyme with NAD(P)H-hydrate epimerase domain
MKPNPLLDELHAVRAQLMAQAGGSVRQAIKNAYSHADRLGVIERMRVVRAKPRRLTAERIER